MHSEVRIVRLKLSFHSILHGPGIVLDEGGSIVGRLWKNSQKLCPVNSPEACRISWALRFGSSSSSYGPGSELHPKWHREPVSTAWPLRYARARLPFDPGYFGTPAPPRTGRRDHRRSALRYHRSTSLFRPGESEWCDRPGPTTAPSLRTLSTGFSRPFAIDFVDDVKHLPDIPPASPRSESSRLCVRPSGSFELCATGHR